MARLLVTGGAGFIGSNFVRFWRAAHPSDQLTVLDALTYAGNRSTLAGIDDLDLVVGDIRDTGLVVRLLAERGIDTIVHFAAETHVDRSIDMPDLFIDTNVSGTHSLLKAARGAWLTGEGREHRFHHVSTDEVYGSLDAAGPAFTEATSYAPNSPYSASKAAADHLVRAYCQTFGLNATISHCSNNYGPYQHPEKLIPRFMVNALLGRPLPVYGNGLNVRDWLHVSDHCRGIEAILQRGVSGERYNLGGCAPISNLDVTEMICREIDAAFAADPELQARFPEAPAARQVPTTRLVQFVADRQGHDLRYETDITKARSTLGYAPAHSFPQGLAQSLSWYLNNESWWQRLEPA